MAKMFVLVAQGSAGPLYYTGRAVPGWTSPKKAEAFEMGLGLAAQRQRMFAGMVRVHGLQFEVEEAEEG